MDQRSKLKSYKYKTLQRKQRKSFMTLHLAMIPWKQNQRHKEQKENKLDFIKMKNFGTSNDAKNIVKRQLTEWEIFASHISDKNLISRIYREFLKFKNKNIKQLDSKIGKRLQQTVLQRRYTKG